MKKLLLATTAVAGLVAFAPAAHAEIDLNVGGSFKAYYGVTDQNTANRAEEDLKRKGEIHFSGETTLDNGLTVGVHTEFVTEPDANAVTVTGETNDVEESYIYFSGNWGRVNVGAEDGAAYLLQVAAPSADSNVDGLDPEFQFVNNATTADLNYANDISADGDKITYLSPKFNGFQVGASYAPEVKQQTAAENLAGAALDNTAGNFSDLYEAAVRYDGEVEGFGVHLGAGYATADLDGTNATLVDDVEEWSLGAKVAFDAFTVGAAYNLEEAASTSDTETVIIGGDYTFGAYKLGVSYLESEAEVAGSSDDETKRASFGGVYNYAPGLSFRGSVNLYEMDSANTANRNDATSFLVGTDITF